MLAQAADSAEYNSNGQITFEPNTDPTNQSAQRIQIQKIQSNQLIQQTQMDQIREPTDRYRLILLQAFTLAHKNHLENRGLSCGNPKYVDSANENQEGPNFVQVTDNRGTESGWTLNVRQNGQFKTAEDQELTAAQIRLTGNVVTPSLSPKPSNVSTTITLNPNGAQSLVMSAQDGEGAGTYLMSWGDSLAAAMDSIELEVPGSTTKYASQYNTTFTWLLTDTPTNP